jgi:ABC-2 type transport system ATP-binding protein
VNDSLIETSGLIKTFGGHVALHGIDLEVGRGSIFGFLGRNGAGKSTTIRLLLGFINADHGEARLFGEAVRGPRTDPKHRSRLGFVSEQKDLYPYMTVEQIIRFTRPLFPGWRNDLERKYLRIFDLPPKRKVGHLSKGMRSKLMLLLAISHGAELLILDEPTDGLDPAVLEEVLQELVALAGSDGTTIFFSSHQLSEVEQIADRVAILDEGRIVLNDDLDCLKEQYQRLQLVFEKEPPEIRWPAAAKHVRQSGRMVSILARGNVDEIITLARSMAGSVERTPVSLKEIFLNYVRKT